MSVDPSVRRDGQPGPTHACPGGCGCVVSYSKYTCPACWTRVPGPFRHAVNRAARRMRSARRDPVAHAAALFAVRKWLTENPGPADQCTSTERTSTP